LIAQLREIYGSFQSLRSEAVRFKAHRREVILSANVDKEEMKSYLLGALDADRKSQLEERILSEPDVYEALLLTEEELIDQYVAGTLSELEQQQFETNFLVTSERQKNLQFGRLLKRYVNSHAVLNALEQPLVDVHQQEEPVHVSRSFPFHLSPFGWRPALASSGIVIALAGIIFLLWLAERKPTYHVAQTNTSLAVVVPLTPGSTRSSGAALPRLQVPPKGSDVKFELEIANPGFHNYKSELLRENNSLQTIGELKAEAKGEQHVVPLTISGELLCPGDYQVRLSGVLDSGANEFIDNYSFRVIE